MRSKGEGSVRQRTRADGSIHYEARTYIHGTRRSFYGPTRATALAAARQARADAERGHVQAPETLTVGAHVTDWLERQVKPTVRSRTYAARAGHIHNWIIPCLGKRRLVDVTPGEVTAMLAKITAAGRTDNTAHHVCATLSAAYKAAMLDYGVTRNPAALAREPKTERPTFRPEVVSPDDARRLLQVFEGARLWPLVAFSLATGVRQGELRALRWQDVDRAAGTVSIELAIDLVDGQYILARPKSAKSVRTLGLNNLACRALDLRATQEAEERAAAAEMYQGVGLVFAGPLGAVRDGTAITRNFRDRLARRGLPVIRWHALRRIFAATLQSQGVPLHVIRDIMGHSQIRVTETYAYTMPGSLAEHIAAIDAALDPGGEWGYGGGDGRSEQPKLL